MMTTEEQIEADEAYQVALDTNKDGLADYNLGADMVGEFFTEPPKNLHTRQLLARLHTLRSYEVTHMQWAKRDLEDGRATNGEHEVSPFATGGLAMLTDLIQETKAELATREHVPNKLEAKAIRQAKARERRYR